MGRLISENEIRTILNKFHERESPVPEYTAKTFIKGDWEHKNRVIDYLSNTHGFIKRELHLDNFFYMLTEKGFKLFENRESETVVNKLKSELVLHREKLITECLITGKELDKKEICNYLKQFDSKINYDMTYQALTVMVEDKTVNVRKRNRVNYYSLPKERVKAILPEGDESDDDSDEDDLLNEKPHEPIGSIFSCLDGDIALSDKVTPTPGQVLDLMLITYERLPSTIKENAELNIDPELKTIQLSIPLMI